MAVSDWKTVPAQNTHLGEFSLSGPYGHIFAEMMAQLKAEIDSIKGAEDDAMGEWTEATPARTTTAKAAIEALEAAVGSWTDTTETTTVKAAIEALRPSGE